MYYLAQVGRKACKGQTAVRSKNPYLISLSAKELSSKESSIKWMEIGAGAFDDYRYLKRLSTVTYECVDTKEKFMIYERGGFTVKAWQKHLDKWTPIAKNIVKLDPYTKKSLHGQFFYIFGNHYNWNQDRLNRSIKKGYVIDIETGIEYLEATEEQENFYKIRLKKVNEYLQLRKSRKYDNHPNLIIDLHNSERWKKGLDFAKNNWNKLTEMTEDSYFHFLECVFPKRQKSKSFVTGEAYTHDSNGNPVYLCCCEINNKFYCQYGTVKQYDNNQLFKNI